MSISIFWSILSGKQAQEAGIAPGTSGFQELLVWAGRQQKKAEARADKQADRRARQAGR